jgi:hypothetical protein
MGRWNWGIPQVLLELLLFSLVPLICICGENAWAEGVTATGWEKSWTSTSGTNESLWNGWEKMEISTDMKLVIWHAWIGDNIIFINSLYGDFELDIKALDIKKTERNCANFPYYHPSDDDKYYNLDWTQKKQIKLSNGKIIKLSDFKKYFPNRPDYPFIIVYGLDGFVFADVKCQVRKLVLLRYNTKQKEDLYSFPGGAFCYVINDGETCNGFLKPEVSTSGIIAFIDSCEPHKIILLRKKINS